MNRTQLTGKVVDEVLLNVRKQDMAAVVEAVFTIMTGALEKGDRVTIHGFGTFERRTRHGGKFKHPQTREMRQAPDRVTIHFRPAQELRRLIGSESYWKKSRPVADATAPATADSTGGDSAAAPAAAK